AELLKRRPRTSGTVCPWGKAKADWCKRLGLSIAARRRLIQTSGTVAMGQLQPLAHAATQRRGCCWARRWDSGWDNEHGRWWVPAAASRPLPAVTSHVPDGW